MSEIESEQQRNIEGNLGRDFFLMTPEAIALRALIDALDRYVDPHEDAA